MSESESIDGTLASVAKVHGGAVITHQHPLTVQTPLAPWSYAISLPLKGPPEPQFVVEVIVRVLKGTIAASCTEATHESLAGEMKVGTSSQPCRLQLLADPEHATYLLIRTAGEPGPAIAEIHSVGSRPLTADERAAISRARTLQPIPRWSRYYGTAGESVVEQARVREYLRLAAPLERPWIERFRSSSTRGDQLSRALYVSGLYEPNTALVLKRLLKSGSTFVDVGAHVGVFTLLGSRFVGESGHVFSWIRDLPNRRGYGKPTANPELGGD